MKKILVLSVMGLFSINCAHAYLDEYSTGDIPVLRSAGYSESMLRVVDTVRANNQGIDGSYQRYFTKKPDTGYSNLKIYFDPIQEDGLFGEHQINFANNWRNNETEYSSRVIENIENL